MGIQVEYYKNTWHHHVLCGRAALYIIKYFIAFRMQTQLITNCTLWYVAVKATRHFYEWHFQKWHRSSVFLHPSTRKQMYVTSQSYY